MPQVKGQATWLTNVRQEAVQRKAGIDDSYAKLENEKIEAEMMRTLEGIHLAGHRAKTDREFEMKETKTTADTYAVMQCLVKENKLDNIVIRRKTQGMAQSAGPARTTKSGGFHGTPGPDPGARRPNTGFANVSSAKLVNDNDDSDFDEDNPSPRFQPTPGLRSGKPRRGKKGYMPPRRSRQTFLGRSLREIRKSLYDEFTTQRDEQEKGPTSYHELKDASNIDKIRDAQAQAKIQRAKKVREMMMEQEKFHIQQKLKSFYRSLETFKGNPNKHNPRTGEFRQVLLTDGGGTFLLIT